MCRPYGDAQAREKKTAAVLVTRRPLFVVKVTDLFQEASIHMSVGYDVLQHSWSNPEIPGTNVPGG